MMLKHLWITWIAVGALSQEIMVTPAQEQSWNITLETAQKVVAIPLGKMMMEVTIPPQMMHTLSLPFEGQLVRLHTAAYTPVTAGMVLAEIGGDSWLKVQQSAIADRIDLYEKAQTRQRKTALCEGEIIAQKECIAAESAWQNAVLKASASQAVLRAYGADEKAVDQILERMEVRPYLALTAPVTGTVMALSVPLGAIVPPSQPILMLKQDGVHWLESAMPVTMARHLHVGDEIMLEMDGQKILSRVLQLAPVVDPKSQTRHTRFALPDTSTWLAGLRGTVTVTLPQEAMVVPKKSVVHYEGATVLFVKGEQGYVMRRVTVLSETAQRCFIGIDEALQGGVVTNAAAILKGMLEEEDDE